MIGHAIYTGWSDCSLSSDIENQVGCAWCSQITAAKPVRLNHNEQERNYREMFSKGSKGARLCRGNNKES